MSTKIGVLLVNLGSPSAPTTRAVRKYLFQFLHDKRVIELSRWLWCPILHGIILRTRPKRSARAYAKVWGRIADGSFADEAPLVEITRRQTAKLSELLPANIVVETGMRYGQPSIAAGLSKLSSQGCAKIAILPLYPQFAGATTASVGDEVARALRKIHGAPEIRSLRDYHDDAGYIRLIADSLRRHLSGLGYTPDKVLVSFHGLPKSSVEAGDPYERECNRTFDLLQEQFVGDNIPLKLTFQSRFGPKEWLTPYTQTTLLEMLAQGQKNVVIIAPGFPADCLETLEELSIDAKEAFLAAGGENFSVVPCLNDEDEHIIVLSDLVKQKLLPGW